MKIASWNINGLRSATKELRDFLKKYNIDILCLQEIKVDDSRLPEELKNFDGYTSFWFHAEKPGYSGVSVYSKIKPSKVVYGIDNKIFDKEGRAITLFFDKFVLINFYLPHSGRELARLGFKIEMNKAVKEYLKSFKEREVLVCGDLNVAHNEIDLARPKDNTKNAGFTNKEREFMDEMLADGWIDIFRFLHPQSREYTWWSQRFKARERNVGWRIDYFLSRKKMLSKVKDIKILSDVFGSDHCPVLIELNS